MVADRSGYAANLFCKDLADRTVGRIQITSDGYRSYRDAVLGAFRDRVDFAQLVKTYSEGPKSPERKYSPVEFVCATKVDVAGEPDRRHISTSFAERQNLTMRMGMRRFTRLTNGFSKKIENHIHAVSLHFMYYNFGRIHQTLRVTPAMEAGVSDHVWSLEEIAALAEASEAGA